jgi:alkylation response protein AidB-like acyl-CoA dehydrogenase
MSDPGHPLIFLWGHARSRSTAFLRMMLERGDFLVVHEPFSSIVVQGYAVVDGEKVSSSGELIDLLQRLSRSRPVFVKETTEYRYDVLADARLPHLGTHTFLVRDPEPTIASHHAMNPAVTSAEIGYEHQYEIFELIRRETGRVPVLIESEQLVDRPQAVVRWYCEQTRIPYLPHALTWRPGPRPQWARTSHWHQDAARSAGFAPTSKTYPVTIHSNQTLADFHDYHLPFYQRLRARSGGGSRMSVTDLPPVTAEPAAIDVAKAVAEALTSIEHTPPTGRFPTAMLPALGRTGVLRARWAGPPPGNVALGVELAEQLAVQAPSGVAVGVGLQTETVLSMLCRFAGDSPYLIDLRERVLDGLAMGCLGASEATGGSDLSAVQTLATPIAGGWRLDGAKKFVSLGAVADFVIVLARLADQAGAPTGRLATIAVPLDQAQVTREHGKLGVPDLDTVALRFEDVTVPAEAMIGRPGLGLATISYGLSFERLSVASQVVGACLAALELTVEHTERRVQFGRPLRDHQYLEFRLAEAWAELEVLRDAIAHLATQLSTQPLDRRMTARIAAVKLRAARTGEQVLSQFMQTFGGAAYLNGETPLGQAWIDSRFARFGAGTDEMMLALIAGELRGNPAAYDRQVQIT